MLALKLNTCMDGTLPIESEKCAKWFGMLATCAWEDLCAKPCANVCVCVCATVCMCERACVKQIVTSEKGLG